MPRPDDEYDDTDRRRDDFERPPRRSGMKPVLIVLLVVGLILVVCGAPICIGLLLPAVQKVREAANRVKSQNNMTQVGLAIADYESQHGELPNNVYGPDGKPLLSWRVLILPHMEQGPLYQQFKLDEPWDGPNNIKLLGQMPPTYDDPQNRASPRGTMTSYRGFSNTGAVFERRWSGRNLAGPLVGGPIALRHENDPLTVAKFKDRPFETVLVVEASTAVEWTKPDDLDASPDKPFPPIGGKWGRNRVNVLFADGRVRMLRSDLPETTWRSLITHSGGEVLPPGWDQ